MSEQPVDYVAAAHRACDEAERQRGVAVEAYNHMRDERDKALADLATITAQRGRMASALLEIRTVLKACRDPIAQSVWWMAMDRHLAAVMAELEKNK